MDDLAGRQEAVAVDRAAHDWIAFTAIDEKFALPMALVEAVMSPPPLVVVPHSALALLGVGHLGGRIVPIVDFAALLGREGSAGQLRAYDGRGEVIRLRIPGGSAGLWVDRVERLVRLGPQSPEDLAPIDPTPLLLAALAAPAVAAGGSAPLGEMADQVMPAAAIVADPLVLVEAAGTRIELRRESVVELIEAVPWTPVPRAPSGFIGVGMLRDAALPILSLAALSGLAATASPGGFAVIELEGCRALLAVDRIIGLRFDRQSAEPAAEAGGAFDVAAAISAELRRIVLGFARRGAAAADADAVAGEASDHLAFAIAGQDFAVPIACIERVVGPQRLIPLPRAANDGADPATISGAIEVHGQIVPVAALRRRLGLAEDRPGESATAGGYLILRDADGLGAIAVDRIKHVKRLRSGDIAPPPAEHELIDGVASADGGLLRIIAPARLWGGRE